MIVTPIRTRVFRAHEPLLPFIRRHVRRLRDGDILVVTSKIAALAQGRTVETKDPRDKERWIRTQSRTMLRTPWCWLTKLNGEWCANAGVDESNADGRLILFPKHLQRDAERMRRALARLHRIRRLGVLVTDTRLIPMKRGSMGVAVAVAGFEPLQSYIGNKDLFGRPLKMTESNVAQALAAAAVLAMGEGDERCPLAVIRGARVTFTPRPTPLTSLAVDPCRDLYRAAYAACGRRSRRTSTRRPARS